MTFNEWVYRGTPSFYDNKLLTLARNELPPEKWDYPEDKNCPILRNYLAYTFEKLWSEREEVDEEHKNEYIYEDDKQACFNTGLLDINWQPVYYYCLPNNRPNLQKWKFYNFYNNYTIKYCTMPSQAINELKRPNYFSDSRKLIFDVNLPIVPQWQHILDEEKNYLRIPKQVRENGRIYCMNIIEGAIRNAKCRIEANYKTAVPQWYKGQIQLLAPLYLTNMNNPDLALVLSLSEDGTQYYGHTCLTIDMAYNNARLIAKPESYWLNP